MSDDRQRLIDLNAAEVQRWEDGNVLLSNPVYIPMEVQTPSEPRNRAYTDEWLGYADFGWRVYCDLVRRAVWKDTWCRVASMSPQELLELPLCCSPEESTKVHLSGVLVPPDTLQCGWTSHPATLQLTVDWDGAVEFISVSFLYNPWGNLDREDHKFRPWSRIEAGDWITDKFLA